MTDPVIEPRDELIFQHLGAAVMLCWAELPLSSQHRILDQVDDLIGFAPVPGIQNEIAELLSRRSKK